ncbi:GyrI-like domain-containing protein [Williamsia sp. CHRR-6]|uniref:GyrI-like domain-containing protein n=1 Tax=Williamsia sp. CHRR-6 TaxID=2835871 RepID=UPI001BDB5F75|nr:GyrI-like domain-containing protein [Williamsia sp. CHRR-6]MBT0568164.1 GyrI-like domain-containing protein [Williamsia sp. CHRR-6]
MSASIDFKRSCQTYRATTCFAQIEVPDRRYLMIDGHGDPNTSAAYAEAIAAVYPVAYAVKFASKRSLDRDYVVPPLEALWWAADMDSFTVHRDKTEWDWTLLSMVPDWISVGLIDDSIAAVRAKGAAPQLDRLRHNILSEGRCVQVLHVGPYDDEAQTLRRLHDEYIPNHGLTMTGRHHEIYLSDARRTAPEKLRTILRQPVMISRA